MRSKNLGSTSLPITNPKMPNSDRAFNLIQYNILWCKQAWPTLHCVFSAFSADSRWVQTADYFPVFFAADLAFAAGLAAIAALPADSAGDAIVDSRNAKRAASAS